MVYEMTFNEWKETPMGRQVARDIFGRLGSIGANWFTIQTTLRREYQHYESVKDTKRKESDGKPH